MGIRRQLKFDIVIIIIGIFISLAGCSNSSTGNVNASQTYSTLIEPMLQGFNNNDYTRFSANFDDQLKLSLTESRFHDLYTTVSSKIGSYVANRIYGQNEQSDYTLVTYKAKFTDEPAEVTLTVKFRKDGGKVLVSDFNLDSPKLQAR